MEEDIYELFHQAEKYLKYEEYREAVKIFESILAMDINYQARQSAQNGLANAMFRWGNALLAQGKPEQALEKFQRAAAVGDDPVFREKAVELEGYLKRVAVIQSAIEGREEATSDVRLKRALIKYGELKRTRPEYLNVVEYDSELSFLVAEAFKKAQDLALKLDVNAERSLDVQFQILDEARLQMEIVQLGRVAGLLPRHLKRSDINELEQYLEMRGMTLAKIDAKLIQADELSQKSVFHRLKALSILHKYPEYSKTARAQVVLERIRVEQSSLVHAIGMIGFFLFGLIPAALAVYSTFTGDILGLMIAAPLGVVGLIYLGVFLLLV
jgi:tetratricopeptide (TPR) repeat protein